MAATHASSGPRECVTINTALSAAECFNDPPRRDEYFERLYDDGIVLHGYSPEPLVGKSAVKAFYAPLFIAFPDCHVETDAMLVDGSQLAWRFRFSGTHQGDFQGMPASGRSFEVPGIATLESVLRAILARVTG